VNETHLEYLEKYIVGSVSVGLTEPTMRESWRSALYRFGRIFGGLEEEGGSLMSELIITTGKHQKLPLLTVMLIMNVGPQKAESLTGF